MNIQEISLRDIVVSGCHGATEAELLKDQRFSVDLKCSFNAAKSIRTGKLADSVDYYDLMKLIQNHISSKDRKYILMETILEDLINKIGKSFCVMKIELSMKKLDVAWTPQIQVKKYFYKNLLKCLL